MMNVYTAHQGLQHISLVQGLTQSQKSKADECPDDTLWIAVTKIPCK